MVILLGASEAHLYIQSIAANKRIDGRTRIQRRPEHVTTQSLPQAIGSARVLRGATHILTAIYARLIADTLPRFSIHVNGACDEGERERYRFLEQYAADYLARYAENSSSNLVLPEAGHAWHLRIDTLILCDSGNVTETLMASLAAALKSVRLPTVSLQAPIKEENDMQIDSKDKPTSAEESSSEDALSLRDLVIDHERQQPLSLELPRVRAIFRSGTHWFVDPLPEEEAAADASFLAILSKDASTIMALMKENGQTSFFSPSDLQDLHLYI